MSTCVRRCQERQVKHLRSFGSGYTWLRAAQLQVLGTKPSPSGKAARAKASLQPGMFYTLYSMTGYFLCWALPIALGSQHGPVAQGLSIGLVSGAWAQNVNTPVFLCIRYQPAHYISRHKTCQSSSLLRTAYNKIHWELETKFICFICTSYPQSELNFIAMFLITLCVTILTTQYRILCLRSFVGSQKFWTLGHFGFQLRKARSCITLVLILINP